MRRLDRIGITLISALCLTGVGAAFASPGDVVLVLDNSGSMRHNDPDFSLQLGVAALAAGMEGDTRVAVVLFDQGVRLALPFTPRAEITGKVFRRSLAALNYRGRYTDIPAALDRGIYELKRNGRPEAQKSIVLLTDGVIDTGNAGHDREGARWLREELAADAGRRGIRLYAIALGKKADFKLLQSLVQNTGGEYYRVEGKDELAGALARIGTSLAAIRVEPADQPAVIGPPRDLETPAPAATRDRPAEVATCVASGSANWICPPSATPDLPAEVATAPSGDVATAAETPAEVPGGPPSVPSERPAPAVPLGASAEGQTGQAEVPAAGEMSVAERLRDWGPWLAAVGLPLLVILILLLGRKRGPRVSTAEQVFAAQRADATPLAFLVHERRDGAGQTRHALTMRTTLVGRTAPAPGEEADHLLLDLPEISCRHASIEYKRLAFWLADEESTNGTFLNGQLVTGKVRLKHGDRILFHNLEFEFNWPAMEAAAAKTQVVDLRQLDAHRQSRPGRTARGTRIAAHAPAAASESDQAPPKAVSIFPPAAFAPQMARIADHSPEQAEPTPQPAGAPERDGDPSNAPVPEADKTAYFDDSVTLPSAREVKQALTDYFEE
ncbi:MAG: FHA domain-containing protein [Gammaproteobacteria bacterium]